MRAVGFVALAVALYPRLWPPLAGKASPNPDRGLRPRAAAQKAADGEAARIWEEAVAAKGGRQRLYAVRNILVSSRVNYLTGKAKKNQARREYLYVLPNKYWIYEDYGPDVFGVIVDMRNYENRTKYFGAPGNPETQLKPLREAARNNGLDNAIIALVLENKWLKPNLLKARTDTLSSVKVEVVEAEINGRRVDFAFDAQTHLPAQISFYNVIDDETYINVQRFSDYAEVGGIKVPQTLTYSDGTVEKFGIQFNVDYDPEIFVKPPARADPEAWRPASKR